MTFEITYPDVGRGNFATNAKLGGTLNPKGDAPGPYYCAPASKKFADMPGSKGRVAFRTGTSCDVNDFAVYRAVQALQRRLGADPDGVFGEGTKRVVIEFQSSQSLYPDGVVGPNTTRALFLPLIGAAVSILNSPRVNLLMSIVLGTFKVESGYDHGSVGVTTPRDLGLGQLNEAAHPDLDESERLEPGTAITRAVKVINSNLLTFDYKIDPAILAYKFGVTGTYQWLKDGSPDTFKGADTKAYLAGVKAGAT